MAKKRDVPDATAVSVKGLEKVTLALTPVRLTVLMLPTPAIA